MESNYQIVLEEIKVPGDNSLFENEGSTAVAPVDLTPAVVRREILFVTDNIAKMKKVKTTLKRIPTTSNRGVQPKDIIVVESVDPRFPKGFVFHGYGDVALRMGYANAQSVSTTFQNSKKDKKLYTKLRGVTLVKKEDVGR